MIRLKRVYAPLERDGYRVLVDRLWPRGLKREDAHIDEWAKEIAPSSELRKWFHADSSRWREFVVRYRRELSQPEAADALERLRARAKKGAVTLLFAAKDEQRNHAAVLRDVLKS